MNVIKKIIENIKNIFGHKKENIKILDTSKELVYPNPKDNFIKSLKENTVDRKNQNRIETLICIGDGLGIKNGISS